MNDKRYYSFSQRLGTLIASLALGHIGPASAGMLDLSGSAGVDARFFTESPVLDAQESDDPLSVVLEPELRWESDDSRHQITVMPFFRWDSVDEERTHGDLREGYYRRSEDRWQLLIGVNKVFWGVAESRHLVDVINPSDVLEDIDEEDKLGQPMIQLSLHPDWGTLELFAMPYFREREFAGRDGRLRVPLPVSDSAEYESGNEEWHPDVALRYSHYFGDWDVGLHYFYGTGREPVLRPVDAGLVPHYSLIHQAGLDLQYTRNAWLWKLESIVREGQGDTFAAMVGGFEYTLYQLLGSGADLGLLAEYHEDGRDSTAPVTTLDNDVFAGFRLALNDIQDSAVLVGTIVDTQEHSIAGFFEAERRLGDAWMLELQARVFTQVDADDPLVALSQEDFLNLSIRRHF